MTAPEQERGEPERWSGKMGFIMATIGSAVGLGSIWKFPYEVGENGGAAFVLFYCIGLLLVVIPLMLAEFVIGRRGGGDALASFQRLAQVKGFSQRWRWVGWLMILTGFLILSYYSVIAGMTVAYALHSVVLGFEGVDGAAAADTFQHLVGDPLALATYQAVFMAATVLVVARGIGKGVELACKVLMPLLALLMVLLVAYAVIEGAVAEALAFLFLPKEAAFSPRAALEALGLGFFSIGVGMGIMVTYAAYAGRELNLTTAVVATVAGDTAISLLAGLAIFPLVFAVGLDPASGANLMFLTLPLAFGALPLGDWVALAFFLLLFVAALASAMSLLELLVAPLRRILGISRARAAFAMGVFCWLLGIPTVLSFNLWSDARPFASLAYFADLNPFEIIDGMTSNLLLPLSGLLVAAFAAWRLNVEDFQSELGWKRRSSKLLRGALRWICPLLILATLFAAFL
jgi:NSS family neurotransmitter:Na+ symporter